MRDEDAILGSELLRAALEAGAVLRTDEQKGFMRLESRSLANTVVADTLMDLYRYLARAGGYNWGNV